jgi:hypothetical protein
MHLCQYGILGIAAPVVVSGQIPAALALLGPRRDADRVDALRERVVSSGAAVTLALDQPETDGAHASRRAVG